MEMEEFELPDSWNLSEQQEVVLGSLLDEAGRYLSPKVLCEALYGEVLKLKAPAPPKLRVLIQRCRQILDDKTRGRIPIEIRRNSGWKITKANRDKLQEIIEHEEIV